MDKENQKIPKSVTQAKYAKVRKWRKCSSWSLMAVALIITIPLTALNNIVCYVIVQIAGLMNRSIFFIAGLPGSSIENFYISTSQTWLLYIFILSNIAMLRRLKVRH